MLTDGEGRDQESKGIARGDVEVARRGSGVEGCRRQKVEDRDTDMKVLKTAWFFGGGVHLLVLNINSSHLSVPMPTMNNKGSTQLCQHSELLIHNHRLALARGVGRSSLWGAGTFAWLD